MNQKWHSNLLLLCTALIWGFAFVAQRVGADYLGPFAFNGIRFALGALSLIPVILIFGRDKSHKEGKKSEHKNSVSGFAADTAILQKEENNVSLCKSYDLKQTRYAALAGGCALFLASALQQWGVALTSAGKAGFMTGLYTVLVPIIGVLFLHRRTGIFMWCGAVMAVIGLYLLSMTGYEKPGLGDLVLIIGAVIWALHILIIDYFNQKNIHSLGFACGQFAVCAVLNLVCAVLFEDITVPAVMAAGVPLLYGGLMSVGVAYTLQILGQKGADPTAASIILSLESMFSALGGALILHETMTVGGYIGCICIFIGIVLAQLPQKSGKNQT